MKRIKNNNLLPWFTDDHSQLPASYLKSCREFFDWLDRCNREGFQATSDKQQATSLTSKLGNYKK